MEEEEAAATYPFDEDGTYKGIIVEVGMILEIVSVNVVVRR